MSNLKKRLETLETRYNLKPIPTEEEFKTIWASMDEISKCMFLFEAENFELITDNYFKVVCGYLLKWGLVDKSALTIKQAIAERRKSNV